MKRLACGVIFAASVMSIPLAHAVSPSVVGSWRVTFYLENGRTTGATQCIKINPASGSVAGVPTSGTWTSPTFSGWQGQWIQLGDHVRWFGLTNLLATTESGNISNKNNFEGVSFNHFSKLNGATSSAGSWHGVRVPSCSTFAVNADNKFDLSKK